MVLAPVHAPASTCTMVGVLQSPTVHVASWRLPSPWLENEKASLCSQEQTNYISRTRRQACVVQRTEKLYQNRIIIPAGQKGCTSGAEGLYQQNRRIISAEQMEYISRTEILIGRTEGLYQQNRKIISAEQKEYISRTEVLYHIYCTGGRIASGQCHPSPHILHAVCYSKGGGRWAIHMHRYIYSNGPRTVG